MDFMIKTLSNLLTPFAKDITRGHNYKLTKLASNTSLFQSFFTNRIINHWNNLPHKVVNVESINAFKNGLDKHFREIIYSLVLINNFRFFFERLIRDNLFYS